MTPTVPPFDDSLLSAWLDGECSPEERTLVESALGDPTVADDLARVAEARTALRAAPAPEAPPGFWAAVHAAVEAAAVEAAGLEAAGVEAPVVELASRRRPSRWVAAVGAAAAAVIAAVVLVPAPAEVRPAVGSLVDAHNLRSSIQSDVASTLAPIAVSAGFRP